MLLSKSGASFWVSVEGTARPSEVTPSPHPLPSLRPHPRTPCTRSPLHFQDLCFPLRCCPSLSLPNAPVTLPGAAPAPPALGADACCPVDTHARSHIHTHHLVLSKALYVAPVLHVLPGETGTKSCQGRCLTRSSQLGEGGGRSKPACQMDAYSFIQQILPTGDLVTVDNTWKAVVAPMKSAYSASLK